MLSLFSCNKRETSGDDPPFEVVEATSQEWVAGARGGGRGVNYKIIIRFTSSSILSFDSIWVHTKKLKLTIEKGGNQLSSIQVNQNDTLTLLASDYSGRNLSSNRRQEETDPSLSGTAKAPITYKGAALLRYVVNDKPKFFVLPQLQSLPPIYGQ